MRRRKGERRAIPPPTQDPVRLAAAGSYWAQRAIDRDRREDELARLVRGLLAANPDWTRWRWRRAGPWIQLQPVGEPFPRQGWKIHVSATSRSAAAILAAVAPLLLRERVAFKFAANRARVAELNAPDAPRAASGKFITVYPRDDRQALRIAEGCDGVTRGMAGPAILSDRPLRPGSVVHYRYGGMDPERAIDEDGQLVELLRGPDGSVLVDEREPRFAAPPWATDPFRRGDAAPVERAANGARPSANAVLLRGRYLVRRAIRHSNRGGVYRAEDRETGRDVVIKEARPHVEARGREASDLLRHEARVLSLVEPLAQTPRVVELFEQQAHLLLVLEQVPGVTLREHVARLTGPGAPARDRSDLLALARGLAELMCALHAGGLLLRDFTPNNILVTPAGQLRLVDLEHAHLLADGPPEESLIGTLGYASPEQRAGAPASRADDRYSLGATLAYALTGVDPYLPPDEPRRPDHTRRIRQLVVRIAADRGVDARLARIALAGLDDDPARRLGPDGVLRALEEPDDGIAPPPPFDLEDLRAYPEHALRWLARTIDRRGDHLWPTTCYGLGLDPRNVQTGASGVGIFLCQASRAGLGTLADDLLATAARWVVERLDRGPAGSSGLYFGRSGPAWFLAEAAERLGEAMLLERAADEAARTPLDAANPDVTHGVAGAALTQLALWRATGDEDFRRRAARGVDRLLEMAQRGPDGLLWPVPTGGRSAFSGRTSYGFAHGNAGIANVLLCAGCALDDDDYVAIGLEGLETLLRVAIVAGDGATWPWGPQSVEPATHWCSGSSGVGTALIRGFAVTGDERLRRMAELAACAVVRYRWGATPVQCHGLAGDGEFLLDMCTITGETRFRDMAVQLAEAMHLQRVYDGGLVVLPDESGAATTASFNTGLAGAAAFVLRLSEAAARPLMLDALLARREPAVLSRAAAS